MRHVKLQLRFVYLAMVQFLLYVGPAASLRESLQDGHIRTRNGSSYLLQTDFEDGISGSAWTAAFPNPDNQLCKWNVVRGQAPNLATGPQSDHTLDNIFGHYLYLESKLCERNDMAVLLSAVLTGFESLKQCFTLWYFAYGVAGNLWVVQVDEDIDPADVMSPTNKIQGIRQGNQGKNWQKVRITIDNPTKTDYKLGIFGSSRSSQFGDVAVDDMDLEDGACDAPSKTCDFEDGDCGGEAQSFTPGFLWNVTKARETYMQYDHTDFAPEGHMLFSSGAETFAGAKTEWLTAKFTADPPQCVRFWYRLGDHLSAGVLHVNLGEDSSGSTSYEILDSFTGQINGGHLWEKGQISIVDFHYDYFLQFQAVNGEGTEFAVDDIDMVQGDCEPRINCHFEDGMCGWANSFGDETNWWRIQGRSALLQGAGLSTDHTRHDELGYYVYLGSDMFPNDDTERTANLYSERITRLGWDLCFEFWYHLSSSAHGISAKLTLSQILPAPVDGVQPTPDDEVIWRHTSSEANVWNYGAVGIRNDVESRLMFTGRVRTGTVNDSIGLDDFVLREGSCSPEPFRSWTCPGTDTRIQVRQLCNQHSDCPNSEDERNCGSCTFNSSATLCGYQTKNDSRFTWHFSPQNPGNIIVSGVAYLRPILAQLESPVIQQTFSTCRLRFSVEDLPMNEVVSLNVFLQHGTLRTLIATYRHQHYAFVIPESWHDYDVFVGRHSTPFQIVFEARKSAFVDAAGLMLQDVTLEQCSFPSGTRPCTLGEWECPCSHLCINLTKICDFVDDCGNGEDEMECQERNPLRCDFEDNLCDWTHGEPGNTSTKWLRADSSDLRDLRKECVAVRDHTSGVHGGKFLLLRSPYYSPPNPLDPGSLTGKLLSQRFGRTSSAGECRMTMYVLFCGEISPTEARLVVTLRGLVEREVDVIFAERTGLDWFHMDILISNYADLGDEYALELRGELQYTGESVIAVDDISFSSSCETGSDPGLPEVPASESTPIVPASTTEDMSPGIVTSQDTATMISTTKDLPTSPVYGPSTDASVSLSSAPSTQEPEPQPLLTDGAIIGIATSGVAALLMIGLGAFFYRRHLQSLGSKAKASTYFNFNELDETDGTRNPGYDMDEISGNHPAFTDKRNIIQESLDES